MASSSSVPTNSPSATRGACMISAAAANPIGIWLNDTAVGGTPSRASTATTGARR